MKHAGAEALASLGRLLDELRKINALKERSPGAFYRKGQAFLHFHEDPAGLFADVKIASEWQRHRVGTRAEQAKVLKLVHAECQSS